MQSKDKGAVMKYVLMENKFFMGKESRTSYGIALAEEADEMPGIIDAIVDLSDDQESVIEFVKSCNQKNVDAAKLYDEVDNFLK